MKSAIPTTNVAGCDCLICKPIDNVTPALEHAKRINAINSMATYQFSNEELEYLRVCVEIFNDKLIQTTDKKYNQTIRTTINSILAARNSRGE